MSQEHLDRGSNYNRFDTDESFPRAADSYWEVPATPSKPSFRHQLNLFFFQHKINRETVKKAALGTEATLLGLGALAYLSLYVADLSSSNLNVVDSFHADIVNNLEISVPVLAVAYLLPLIIALIAHKGEPKNVQETNYETQAEQLYRQWMDEDSNLNADDIKAILQNEGKDRQLISSLEKLVQDNSGFASDTQTDQRLEDLRTVINEVNAPRAKVSTGMPA